MAIAVGRDAERATIDAVLDRAGAGPDRGVLFTGEPGVGRTTVLELARERAAAKGWLVLSARGDPSASEHPFDSLAALVRRLEPGVSSLPPHLASAIRVALGVEVGTADPTSIGAALVQLVTRAADDHPVLLALDDVHWFDRSSTAALAMLHRHLDTEPVATVATALAGATEVTEPMWRRSLAVQPVAGLGVEELVPLLGPVTITAEVAERCCTMTQGNPLGFVELVGRLSDRQRTGTDPLPAMTDPGPLVTQAFAARLEGLPRTTRRALTVAAADESGRLEVVRGALSLLGASPNFEPATAAGIVTIHDDVIAFTHPLLRAAAYHGVAVASRRKAHLALATVLDAPGDAEHRAWQLAAAADGPDEPAAMALELVAESVAARGAAASAARVLERAASLSTEPTGAARRWTTAGGLWLRTGHVDQATVALGHALGHALGGAHAVVVPVAAYLWAAVVHRWTVGPGAAAADLRAAADHLGTGAEADVLRAAAADEDALDGLAGIRAPGSPPAANGGDRLTSIDDEAGSVRATLRLAAARLVGTVDDVGSVPDLVAAVIDRSPLALDGAALVARARTVEGDLLGAYLHLTTALATDLGAVPAAAIGAELELARVEVLLGRAADADARLARVAPLASSLGLGSAQRAERAARALSASGAGRADEAVGLLAPIDRAGAVDEVVIAAEHLEALVRSGRPVDVEAWRARSASLPAPPGSLAAGLGARIAGLAGRDRATLEQASEDLAPFPYERARTLLLLADLWQDEEAARAAQQAFDAMGATPWARRAAPAGAVGSAHNPAAAALASLTAAEMRVAAAVGAGLSNREAADELFLSIKTIDHHLQHIYRKLEIKGRSTLAVLVTRGGS